MSSPTGIAILGAGIFAKEAHLPALAELSKNNDTPFELKAVYSRSEASALSLATSAQKALSLPNGPDVYFDVAADGKSSAAVVALDALLKRKDIKGVIIVLPITHQPQVVRAALAAGKHVLSEKPVAKDVEDGIKLIKEYRSEYASKSLVWRVAENFEAETAYRTAAQWIKEGKIGRVQSFDARTVGYIDEDSKYYKTAWRTVPDYQGGFLLDGGVHFAAALRLLLGPLASLSGHASLSKKILAPHDGITATVLAASGAHGTFTLSFAAPHGNLSTALGGNRYAVVGSAGWITIGSGPNGQYKVNLTTVAADKEVKEAVVEVASDGVKVEIGSWLGKINGKSDDLGLGEPEGALLDVAFIEACLTSNGESVNLSKLAA